MALARVVIHMYTPMHEMNSLTENLSSKKEKLIHTFICTGDGTQVQRVPSLTYICFSESTILKNICPL